MAPEAYIITNVMNRRYLHHVWRKFRIVSPWYFSILALIFGSLALHGLRQNNLKMVSLRDAVYRADEQDGDVEATLRGLREHVHSHMNTDLTAGNLAISPPIQLKYRYDRLVKAERERVAAVNEQVYISAQADCERRFPGQSTTGSGRIPCIEEYVSTHGTKEQPIPDALYKFDFVSPRWSPDLAGWSLLFCALSGALFVIRLLIGRWFRATLH